MDTRNPMQPRMPPSAAEIRAGGRTRVRPALPPSPRAPSVAPWVVQAQVVEVEPVAVIDVVEVVPVIPVDVAPWSTPHLVLPDGAPGAVPSLPPAPDVEGSVPKLTEEQEWVEKHTKIVKRPVREPPPPPLDNPLMQRSLLKAANYTAVDPSRKLYGLIDRGLSDTGTRAVLLHVRNRQDPYPIFNKVRPGEVLPATKKSNRGGTTYLRVRYITPFKYYQPGHKISTMLVGVDETDWQSLVAKAHRI